MPENDNEPLPEADLIDWMMPRNLRIIVAPLSPSEGAPDYPWAWWVRAGNAGNRLAWGGAPTPPLAFDAAYQALRRLAMEPAARAEVVAIRERRARAVSERPQGNSAHGGLEWSLLYNGSAMSASPNGIADWERMLITPSPRITSPAERPGYNVEQLRERLRGRTW